MFFDCKQIYNNSVESILHPLKTKNLRAFSSMKDKLCDDFEKRDLYVRHVNYIGSFHFTKICVTIATKIMCT